MWIAIKCKPFGRGRWVELSRHEEGRARVLAEWGWMELAPWSDCWWVNERETEMNANPKMAALLEAIRKPAINTDLTASEVIHRCQAVGVNLILDGDGLIVRGGKLTEELRAALKDKKELIVDLLRERVGDDQEPTAEEIEAEPWNEAKVVTYVKRAREEFGKLFDAVVNGKGGEVWREAAFGIMVDSVSRMAESLHKKDMAEALASVDYVRWLCGELRKNLDRVRQPPPDGVWTTDRITPNGIIDCAARSARFEHGETSS